MSIAYIIGLIGQSYLWTLRISYKIPSLDPDGEIALKSSSKIIPLHLIVLKNIFTIFKFMS